MLTKIVANRNRTNREDKETTLDKLTGKDFDYRAIVGSLQYLASTVLSDISYAVNVLSRQVNPKNNEWQMAK